MIYQVFLSSPYTSIDTLSGTPVSCLWTERDLPRTTQTNTNF